MAKASVAGQTCGAPGGFQLPLKFWSKRCWGPPSVIESECHVSTVPEHTVCPRVNNKTYNQKTVQKSRKRFVSKKMMSRAGSKVLSHTGSYRFSICRSHKLCQKKSVAAGSQPKKYTRTHRALGLKHEDTHMPFAGS